MLSLPATTIPRSERRILGSIYGSSKPERDFPTTLALYRAGRLPLDGLVSHRLSLDEVGRAFELMQSGDALRVVLDLSKNGGGLSLADLDGRIGEGWSGEAPNGSHVNVVLAQRGSPTAAAAISMLANPSPGPHPRSRLRRGDPAGVRAGLAADADDEQGNRPRGSHQTMTWGAAQLGIGQGVLDAVADGLIEASGDLLVLVAVWVDPAADDETAVREANRAATRKALGVCVEGRDPAAAAALVERRDSLRNPFYSRRVTMRIAAIETRRYRYPLEPPFSAAWDPVPRAHQDATLVIVRSDDGVEGYASGDALPDRELLERLLVGVDPLRHGGRTRDLRDRRLPPWPQLDPGGRGLGPRRPLARRGPLAPPRREPGSPPRLRLER